MIETLSYEDLVNRVKGLEREAEKRRQADKALQKSQKTLSQIVQGSPIPTFVIDHMHRVIFWNRACETLTRISASAVMGTRKHWLAFYSRERPVMADLIVDQATEEQIVGLYGDKFRASTVIEDAYEAEDFFPELGERGKWLFFTAAPLKDTEGKIIGAIETLQDVTDRNRAAAALRLEESRLEALLELGQMVKSSLHDITEFALEQAVRLTGSSIGYLAFVNEDETVLTMHAWSKSAMKECAIIDEPITYPLKTTGLWGEALRQRKPLITNDYTAPNPLKKGYPEGHVHLKRHMNIPVFDGDRIVAVAGVGNKEEPFDESDVRQLTLLMQGMWRLLEKKRADEELKKHQDQLEELVQQRTADLIESEEKYRTLVENLPLLVYRLGPSGETLFVNPFVEDMFGFSPDEIFRNSRLWNRKIYDEDRVRVRKLRDKCFREGKEFIAEYRVKHKDGHIIHVSDHAIPFKAADGRISFVDGIMIDVTGRIKLQEQLVQAEGLKTITEVSARLAHEIRNPLMSAGGFARRLMTSMRGDDPNRGKVEIIVKEVGRLETILRMVLNYIQPLELDMSWVPPNMLVEKALSAVDMEIKERNVSMRLQLGSDLPEIFVDRYQMRLVMETLVKQALNQMKEGSILSISTFQEEGMFKLVLRYPVEQMSSDDVEHFFYPFTMSTTRYDIMDLPLSKNLVNKHGGVIDVNLEESGRLVIAISLPI